MTRTFGDIEAKMEEMGGNPNVVIAIPEIKCVQINEEHDFIILASYAHFKTLEKLINR